MIKQLDNIDILKNKKDMIMNDNIKLELEEEYRIKKDIAVGDYFIEARKWYIRTYITPYTQHFYGAILMIITLTCAVILMFIATDNYGKIDLPIAVYTYDQSQYLHKIKQLTSTDKSIESAVAQYLIKYYVETRESYRPEFAVRKDYNEWLNKIRNISSKQVYSEFEQEVNPNTNSKSPIILYRRNSIIQIEIESISFAPHKTKPSSASVNYKALHIKNGKIIDTKRYNSHLIFDMEDIYSDSINSGRYDFLILDYSKQEI